MGRFLERSLILAVFCILLCRDDAFISITPFSLKVRSLKQTGGYLKPTIFSSQTAAASLRKLGLLERFKISLHDLKRKPWKYLSIPLSAAFIGYITNWIGVKMLFYPINWTGLHMYTIPEQPLGLFGWQGIVPCKRLKMANKLVDVTISKLLKINEIFGKLEPTKIADLVAPTLSDSVLGGIVPASILKLFLKKTSSSLISGIEEVVDIKSIVVGGLTNDPGILGGFFQRVANVELKFLVESGFGFGFLLGLLQMLQWMVFPANWTLVVGGSIVGYITNFIALKWIFEPLNPVKWGPFVIQGMFLRRQHEVSKDFCNYISENVLTSVNVWKCIVDGPGAGKFLDIVSRNVPLPPSGIASIISNLRTTVCANPLHPLHKYTTLKLDLEKTLVSKMSRLTPLEFDQIIHPIFQEDELTLILAGAILGGLSGLVQWWLNDFSSKRQLQQQKPPALVPAVLKADYTESRIGGGESDSSTAVEDVPNITPQAEAHEGNPGVGDSTSADEAPNA